MLIPIYCHYHQVFSLRGIAIAIMIAVAVKIDDCHHDYHCIAIASGFPAGCRWRRSASSAWTPSAPVFSPPVIILLLVRSCHHCHHHQSARSWSLSSILLSNCLFQDCGDMLVQRADCCPVCRTDITDVVHFYRCWNISSFFIGWLTCYICIIDVIHLNFEVKACP